VNQLIEAAAPAMIILGGLIMIIGCGLVVDGRGDRHARPGPSDSDQHESMYWTRWRAQLLREPIRGFVAPGSIAFLAYLGTGWPLPSIVLGMGLRIALLSSDRSTRSVRNDLERLEALSSWVENLRDVLIAGEQPLGAILATSRRVAPGLVPAVRRLSFGLQHGDVNRALRRFADDLDDPVSDLVATGLMAAFERGGRSAEMLTRVAEQTRQSIERRRIVEAERAPVVREVQIVTAIMALLMGAIILTARTGYLPVYSTPVGQVVLAGALIMFGALAARTRRLAAFPRPARYLLGAGT